MAKIDGVCKQILDKTEWVAIATSGDDGPHLVATWGDYITIQDGQVLLVPAGGYRKTEANLRRDPRVQVLIASREVPRANGQGQGCVLSGTGELQSSGPFLETAKAKFPWARGVLVVRVEDVREQ